MNAQKELEYFLLLIHHDIQVLGLFLLSTCDLSHIRVATDFLEKTPTLLLVSLVTFLLF